MLLHIHQTLLHLGWAWNIRFCPCEKKTHLNLHSGNLMEFLIIQPVIPLVPGELELADPSGSHHPPDSSQDLWTGTEYQLYLLQKVPQVTCTRVYHCTLYMAAC